MQPFWEIVVSNAVLVVVFAVGVALLGRVWKNPLCLHLLWVFVLLKFVTPPLLTVPVAMPIQQAPRASEERASDHRMAPEWPVATPYQEPASITTGREPQPIAIDWASNEGPALELGDPVLNADPPGIPWLSVLGWLWGVGIVLLAFRHAYRVFRFRTLLRSSKPASSAVLSMAEEIAKRLGLRRVPEIRMLPICVSPLVWSLGGKPRVFLPTALFERLAVVAQESILAHELAHVRRKDHWVRLLEVVVTTLFWWHPVVWWAARRLQELEEQCCDAMVVDLAPHGAKSYATALLDTLEFLCEPSMAAPLGTAAARSSFSVARRIAMLKNRSWSARWTFGRMVLLLSVAALPMALAFAATPPQPSSPHEDYRTFDGKTADRGSADGEIVELIHTRLPIADGTRFVAIRLRIVEIPKRSDVARRLPSGGIVLSEADVKHLLDEAQSDKSANVLQAPVVTTRLGECAFVSSVWRDQQLVCQVVPEATDSGDAIALRIKPDRAEGNIPESEKDSTSTLAASEIHWNDPEKSKWRTSIHAEINRDEAVVFGGWGQVPGEPRNGDDVTAFVVQASYAEPDVAASAAPIVPVQPAVQLRPINKSVKDFPEKTDLSSPESAQAAWNRACASMDAKAVCELGAWKYGPRDIEELERFWKTDPKDIAVYNEAQRNAEVLEVATYREDLAQVVSKLKFPEGVGRHPYSARVFGKISGVWKNLGEDRLPSLEAARENFEHKKEHVWKDYVRVRESIKAGRPVSAREETADRSAKIAPGETLGISIEKADLMGRVEWAMMHGGRDVTARKSIEWGEVEKDQKGNRTIRYKYYATIWDKDVYTMNQVFTFDGKGNILDVKNVEGFPRKKVAKPVNVNTQEGMKELVEDFFSKNFRDVTAREGIEWGEVTKADNGNSSIRYKYRATIWDKDVKIMNQIFTFDPKGKFVSVKNVEGFPKDEDRKELPQGR